MVVLNFDDSVDSTTAHYTSSFEIEQVRSAEAAVRSFFMLVSPALGLSLLCYKVSFLNVLLRGMCHILQEF